MPLVYIKLNEGKSEKHKKAMAEGIVQSIVDAIKVNKNLVRVGFEEYSTFNGLGDIIYAIVHTIEGKTTDEKRQMASGIAHAIVDGARVDISVTRVGFLEYPKDSYAIAGELLSDR